MEAEVAELKKQVAALTKELTRVSGKNPIHDSGTAGFLLRRHLIQS